MAIATVIFSLLLGIVFLATFIYIIVWVYRDANRSGIMPGWLAVLIVIIIPHFIGLIVYLVLRFFLPAKQVCRSCGSPIPPDSRFCPSCAAAVFTSPSMTTCQRCGRAVPTDARYCPYCSATNEHFVPTGAAKGSKGCLIAIVAAVGIIAGTILLGLAAFNVGSVRYHNERAYSSEYLPQGIPTYTFDQTTKFNID